MTPGERFDQDEVLRFGDPWHGLYRNGVTELPNATTRVPGRAPSDGSSFAIRIPGQPAVTTSTEDAAQGMTWLNYAIMTGEVHEVYGRPMGRMAWIFIDADSVPWRAELVMTSGLMTVTLHRVGIIGGDGGNPSYSASVAFALPASFGGTGEPLFRINDIDSAGRQMAFTYRDAYTAGYIRVFLLTLSGSGASFALGLSEETPDPPVVFTSGTFGDHDPRKFWIEDNGVLAGVFPPDAQGNIDFEFLEGHSYKVSYGPALHPHSWIQYVYALGATLIDDTFALVRGTIYTEYEGTATIDQDHLFDHWLPGQVEPRRAPVSYVESSETATYTITLNGIDTEVSGEWPMQIWQFPPFTPEEVAGQGYEWTPHADRASYVPEPPVVAGHAELQRPYSTYAGYFADGFIMFGQETNRTYRLFLIDRSNRDLIKAQFMVCGPNDGVIAEGWETDQNITYATAHPVSGDMVTGSTPVCFV